jgi:hypothetical protein
MRLLPTVSIILLTGSALALIQYTSYDDNEGGQGLSPKPDSSSLRSNLNASNGEGAKAPESHLHRNKRSLFSQDSRKIHVQREMIEIMQFVFNPLKSL